MLTELQTRKWKRLFDVYDADGNGVVEKRDFETIFQNFAVARNLTPGSDRYEEFYAKFMEDWEHLRKDVDKNNNGQIELDEWLQHGDNRINSPEMEQTNIDLVNQTLELLDLDGNGIITLYEYTIALQSWRVSADLAEEIFCKLDLNDDGVIDKAEFVELVRQFNMSDDPDAPGNFLFGPF